MEKEKNIRQKIRRLFLLLSMVTLIVSSMLALGGMMITGNKLEAMGEHLGKSARDSVMKLVAQREKEHLEQLVHERGGVIDALMKSVAGDAEIISKNAEAILSEPQRYLPQELIRAQSLEDGWSLALMLTPSAVDNLENLRGNISMAANNQNYLKNVALSYNSMDCSVYVTFEDGFGFIVDTGEADMKAHYFNNPLDYSPTNFFERPWYKNAKEQNRTVFSDAVLNSNSSFPEPIIVCSTPINLNGEFVGVTGIGFFVEDIGEYVLNTSIDKTGFSFLMNDRGQVIASSKEDGDLSVKDYFPDLRKSTSGSLTVAGEKIARGEETLNLSLAAEKMTRGEKGLVLVQVDGEDYFLAFEPLQNVDWSFGALIKVSEVTTPADAVAMLIDQQTDAFIDRTEGFSFKLFPFIAGAFLILFGAVSLLSERLAKSFVKPIQRLSDGVREISSGNFDKKIDDIKTGDEIEHLATCFNAMTDELKTYMANLKKETAENERISTELNVATNIQLSMLPHNFPSRADFELYATMNAAKEVGGDFYDFYFLDDNHLMITIADVSGKGVPAALFMAISKVILKNFALTMKNPDDLGAVMTLANQQLCQGNDEMMFVTVFMGMLDLKTGKFVYVNGGHNPPLVYRDGKFEYLSVEQNCVLGMMEDLDYEQQEIQLAAGDILYLYTDGVTEAMNENNGQYGEERLLTCLNEKNCSCDLHELLERVKKDLSKHVGAAQQSDDITMLAVRFNGDK